MQHDDTTSPGSVNAPITEHPDRIGPYRILQVLGEGGMGIVYAAEQSVPISRRVAVKVLKLGMDTKQFVARFETERQAIAVMDHPGIARVHDAGATESGRPYFVMELVHGVPITEYCDLNRVPTRQRVELMIAVCHAVQHAHQKGVIHRDLKPSNVLVTVQDGGPVPKIIDFGVAKAIDHRLTNLTLYTEVGQRIGTPAYMSPEQMEMSGLDIDTRTDIYSLGMMLYELLTGTLPFSQDLLLRAVNRPELLRDTNPLTPSACLTNLGEKRSAVALQHQSDPVSLRRALQGDLDWITLKAIAMDRTRRYETANGLAMDLQRCLAFEPIVARPPSTRYRVAKFVRRHRVGVALSLATALLVLVATVALAGLAQRLARERDRAEREAARANSIATFLQDTLSSADPWSGGNREVSVTEALGTATARVDRSFRNQPLVAAAVRRTIAATYMGLGRFDEAATLARSALEAQRTALGGKHEDVAETLMLLADIYRNKGLYDEAESFAREALSIRRELTGSEHAAVGASLHRLASVLEKRGRYKEAEAAAEEALRIRQRVLGARHKETADSLGTLATVIAHSSDFSRAERLIQEELEIRHATQGRDHPDVAATLNNLAVNRLQVEDYAQAESLYRESLAMHERTLGHDHPEVAVALENLGGVYFRTKRYDETLRLLDQVLTLRRKRLGDNHTAVGRTLHNIGVVRNAAKDYAGAVASLTEAELRLRSTMGAEHPELVIVLRNLGDALNGAGDRDAAEKRFREALALAERALPADHTDLARVRVQLGNLLVARKRFAEAEPLLIGAVDARQKKLGADNASAKAAVADLIKLYDAWNKPEQAREWRLRGVGR